MDVNTLYRGFRDRVLADMMAFEARTGKRVKHLYFGACEHAFAIRALAVDCIGVGGRVTQVVDSTTAYFNDARVHKLDINAHYGMSE